MTVDNVVSDREPKASAAAVGRTGLVETGEPFEDSCSLVLRYAGTIVIDCHPDDVPHDDCGHCHR